MVARWHGRETRALQAICRCPDVAAVHVLEWRRTSQRLHVAFSGNPNRTPEWRTVPPPPGRCCKAEARFLLSGPLPRKGPHLARLHRSPQTPETTGPPTLNLAAAASRVTGTSGR